VGDAVSAVRLTTACAPVAKPDKATALTAASIFFIIPSTGAAWLRENSLVGLRDSVIIATMLAGNNQTGKRGTSEHSVFWPKYSDCCPCDAPICLLQYCLGTL
jgi:hypothetical protein